MAAAVVVSQPLEPPDVVVIGAGCAGLSAAVRLAGAGRRVLVLEARSRLGGRATAFKDRETGELVDNGQHVLTGCYVETLAFLHAIGAGDHVRIQPQLAVTMIDRDGVRTRLNCGGLPAPLHLLAGLWRWPALSWRDRWSIWRMAGPIRTAYRESQRDRARTASSSRGASAASSDESGVSSAEPPDETVAAWLIRLGQSTRIREMLWDPLALAALNQPSDVAAAAPFARVLGEMFGGRDRQAAALVIPTRPLHEMYAEPARAFIEQHGGVVRTGASATVRLETGSRPVVICGEDQWRVPSVIVAVPWFALPTLFVGDVAPLAPLIEAARATTASPIATVNLWFDRPVMDEPFLGLPGRVLQWVFDKRLIFEGAGRRTSHLSLVSSGAGEAVHWTNEKLIAVARQELEQALPLVRAAQLINATVIREPRATFSLAPGQPARPSTATTVPGVFLAGDWIDTGLPATIESAVRSGHRAAHAVITASPPTSVDESTRMSGPEPVKM